MTILNYVTPHHARLCWFRMNSDMMTQEAKQLLQLMESLPEMQGNQVTIQRQSMCPKFFPFYYETQSRITPLKGYPNNSTPQIAFFLTSPLQTLKTAEKY